VVTIEANDTDNHVPVTLENPLTQVLGTAVTPPPTTVQAATLPRTGAPDTIWLLVIGFMLVLGGGCFVVAARIDD
jgi:LPXTG-motif cell wall-anchored protein